MIAPFLAVLAAASFPDADELMKKSHLAHYYAGADQAGESTMKIIEKDGKERVREMVGLRLDKQEGGDQKYYVYFKKPADVARLSYVVHKKSDANDSRWIYVPSVDLVKPIVADDKTQSFVGSDFTYEDISGRTWTLDKHKVLREETLDKRKVFVVESVPKKSYPGYERKISYVDTESFLPLRMEFYLRGKLTRVYRAENVTTVQGFPTVMTHVMEDLDKKRKTTFEFRNIKYGVGLKDDIFAERYLKAPPREWIK